MECAGRAALRWVVAGKALRNAWEAQFGGGVQAVVVQTSTASESVERIGGVFAYRASCRAQFNCNFFVIFYFNIC